MPIILAEADKLSVILGYILSQPSSLGSLSQKKILISPSFHFGEISIFTELGGRQKWEDLKFKTLSQML